MHRSHRRPGRAPGVLVSVVAATAVLVLAYAVAWYALPPRQPVTGGQVPAATTSGAATSRQTGDAARPSDPGRGVPPRQAPRAPDSRDPSAAAPSPDEPAGAAAGHWRHVLVRLGEARAQAWRIGDPSLLRAVWTDTSTGLAADRAMLDEWTTRGFTLRGVSMVVDSVRVLHQTPGRVLVRTVDRLGPVDAERRTGDSTVRRSLPRDQPTPHRISLVRTAHGWRFSEVTPLD